MLRFLADHQRNGDAVGQLGKKGNHFVVFFRREGGDGLKAQLPAQIHTGCNSRLGIFSRGRHDIVGAPEDLLGSVLHAADLTACHGVGTDEFQVAAQHILHGVDDAALHAGDVGQKGTGTDIVLILPEPVQKNVGVEGKDDEIELADIVRVCVAPPMADEAVFQSVIDGCLPAGQSAHLNAPVRQRLGVAAAHETEAHDQDLGILIQSHRLPPIQGVSGRGRSPGSFFAPLRHL